MKVCFIHVESAYPKEEIEIHRALAKRMIQSVKTHLRCDAVQLTDLTTPAIEGADGCERVSPEGSWIAYSLELLQSQFGEVLFLDTDCVVQEDISGVFNDDFDVALTLKKKSYAKYVDQRGKTHLLPSNGGVMFSRTPEFWREKKEIVEKMTDPMSLAWWGGGIALNEIIKREKYKVLWLDADRYNYTPNSPDEDLKGKAVVHYKGRRRKHWNLPGEWRQLPEAREMAVSA